MLSRIKELFSTFFHLFDTPYLLLETLARPQNQSPHTSLSQCNRGVFTWLVTRRQQGLSRSKQRGKKGSPKKGLFSNQATASSLGLYTNPRPTFFDTPIQLVAARFWWLHIGNPLSEVAQGLKTRIGHPCQFRTQREDRFDLKVHYREVSLLLVRCSRSCTAALPCL